MCQILAENFRQAVIHLSGIYEYIGFKITFETTEVEIGRSDRCKFVVDDQRLGMKHSGLIEINLNAGF